MTVSDDLRLEISTAHNNRHLALDSLVINPRLARRLPPALAFRYHALPLAEDQDHITVAMANPDDETALEAITDALGTKPYIVRSDSKAIDSLLTQLWPTVANDALHLLVHCQASPIAEQVQAYAQYLSHMLGSRLGYLETEPEEKVSNDDMIKAAHRYNLVIFGEPDQTLIQRLFSRATDVKAVEQLPASVLIAHQPRWPLRHVLLIIRGLETDDVAVDWTVRLAQPSHASVTVLPLVPSVPSMCTQMATMQHGLAQWLATDTALGQQMRSIAQQLANWETKGKLRLRQGPAELQIQHEVVEGDYDLIVIAADPANRWSRRVSGELVTPLLRCTNRPVLIAKPTGC